MTYAFQDFDPRKDVIFKRQFFCLFLFLFYLLMFSAVLHVQVKLVFFSCCATTEIL